MGELFFTIVVGGLAFAATHLDDLLVLMGTLASDRVSTRDAVRGQVIGTAALLALSFAAALGTILIPPGWHHWLGLLPLGAGIHQLYGMGRRVLGHQPAPKKSRFPQAKSAFAAPPRGGLVLIALLAIANGGDNLAVYTALFNAQSFLMSAVTMLVGLGLAALWAGLAAWLVNHAALGTAVRRAGPWLLPWVLIGLGVLILLPDR